MPDPAFEEKLRALVEAAAGVGGSEPARDPVNQPMIRHWCDAMDDQNPAYTDPEFAGASVHGDVVAPPAMLQAWTMRGLRPPPRPESDAPNPFGEVMQALDTAGFTSVVATNCTQEYRRYLHPGDHLTVESTLDSVSPEKQTGLGIGHFVTQRMVYRDQDGEEVATMLFRILKFKPGTGRGA